MTGSCGREETDALNLIFYTDSTLSVTSLKQTLNKFKPVKPTLSQPDPGALDMFELKGLCNCVRNQVSDCLGSELGSQLK